MRRDVPGACLPGKFEPLTFNASAGEVLDADRDDINAGITVALDNFIVLVWIIEIGVHTAHLDGIEANVLDLLCYNIIIFEVSEAETLHTELAGGGHSLILM